MKAVRPLAASASIVIAAVITRSYGVQFRPLHTVLPPPQPLGDAKERELGEALAKADPRDRANVQAFALDFTGRNLVFSLGHLTSFAFPVGTRRTANCVEYTYLFVAVFNTAAKRARLPIRALRIRSSDARVFGMRIPIAGFADHDWALILDATDGARSYTDPTFSDAYLGADIRTNVVDGDKIRPGWVSVAEFR